MKCATCWEAQPRFAVQMWHVQRFCDGNSWSSRAMSFIKFGEEHTSYVHLPSLLCPWQVLAGAWTSLGECCSCPAALLSGLGSSWSRSWQNCGCNVMRKIVHMFWKRSDFINVCQQRRGGDCGLEAWWDISEKCVVSGRRVKKLWNLAGISFHREEHGRDLTAFKFVVPELQDSCTWIFFWFALDHETHAGQGRG